VESGGIGLIAFREAFQTIRHLKRYSTSKTFRQQRLSTQQLRAEAKTHRVGGNVESRHRTRGRASGM